MATILLLVGSCGSRDQPQTFAPRPPDALASVVINRPAKLHSIETPQLDSLGRPTRIACVTCHAIKPPRPLPTRADQLKEFHVGLVLRHGGLPCASCHVEGRVDALHLADGTVVPMTDAIRLCAQCHGPQYRDYLHGSHGGMSGHWDLRKGPRLRNHCVDCHEAHAPHSLPVLPVLPPVDRFPPAAEQKGTPSHHE